MKQLRYLGSSPLEHNSSPERGGASSGNSSSPAVEGSIEPCFVPGNVKSLTVNQLSGGFAAAVFLLFFLLKLDGKSVSCIAATHFLLFLPVAKNSQLEQRIV